MRYTLDEIDFLKLNYPILGATQCADKLGRTASAITTKANSLGLKLLPQTKSKMLKNNWAKRNIIYKVDPAIFINCQTKEVAYILGLLWTDGYIQQKNYLNDIKLENIKTDIDIFYPIFLKTGDWKILFRKRKNRQKQGLIRTSNKVLANFLIKNNYGPHNIESANKILNLIPNNLQPYWFRGLVDGDGCWYLNIKNSCRQFTLAGSYYQDWSYFENLLNQLKIKYSIQRIKNKTSSYSCIRSFGKNNLTKLGNYIYKDYKQDNIGLNRKYKKFIEIKNS